MGARGMGGDRLLQLSVASTAVALRRGGCPVCSHVSDAGGKLLRWFALENYGQMATLVRLRASAGMCPAHTRRILAEPGAQNRLITVYRQVLPAAAGILTAQPAGPVAACPACHSRQKTADGAVSSLLTALADPATARAYRQADGLCVTHLRAAIPADPTRGALLVGVALQRLSASPDDLSLLAGWDDDAADRATLRASPPAPAPPPQPRHATTRDTVTRLRDRLDLDCCPTCLVEGQAERQHLYWICQVHASGGAEALRSQPGGFCPTHLHDLAGLDAAVAGWALTVTRTQWTAKLTRTARLLADLPPTGLAARLRRAWTLRAVADTEPRPGLLAEVAVSRTARTAAAYAGLDPDDCMVCRAVRQQAHGETQLLLAGLALPPLARHYEASHGLCLRHLLTLPTDDAHTGLPRQVLHARLGLLVAELGEADRKRAWQARHEDHGPETSAWLRAPALLDGAVFLGGPARTWW